MSGYFKGIPPEAEGKTSMGQESNANIIDVAMLSFCFAMLGMNMGARVSKMYPHGCEQID